MVRSDSIDSIRQRLELAEHFPETFGSGNSAADRWREDVTTLLAEVETWGRIWNNTELLAARVEALRDGTAQT